MPPKPTTAGPTRSGAPARRKGPKEADPPAGFQTISAFYIFFGAHAVAALYSPIQDCDEVYNYWEPTHYLNHGYGMQTWEYSPEYAIRSWAYAGLHAVLAFVGRLLPFGGKVFEFYFVRFVLAFVCAVCEARLYSAISKTLNPRIAAFFLMIMVFSPGMFHASTAYLPSSFAMYSTMLGVANFMNWKGGFRTAQGIFWFAFGGILGWPFATALVAPFLLEELLVAAITQQWIDTFMRFVHGTTRAVIVLAITSVTDSLFYKKIVCVPLNIVWYNVFSRGSKGPNIYGTEPWHFYIRNLFLNFNVWFLLAVGAMPLVLLHHFVRRQAVAKETLLRSITFTSPFYLWLAIFTLQPHKEERFMFPAYPVLALNAAMSFHIILAHFGSSDPKDAFSKIPPRVKLVVVSIFVLGSIDLGVWRAAGMATAYSAPLKIYAPLQLPNSTLPSDIICMGKEWYRYPSSYFIPAQVRTKFIRSAFTGLLPGEFREAKTGFGLFPGAWLTPPGMNDENIEDPGKYTDIKHCNFLVDSYFPYATPSTLEPNYMLDTDTWEQLSCQPFLDQARSGTLGRLGWLPDWQIIPERHRRQWGQYCLLRRKRKGSPHNSVVA